MTTQQAQTAITLSALVTAGVYFYRKLTEGESTVSDSKHVAETTARAFGSGPVLPLGQWVPAAGFTFLTLALLGAASPSVGGGMAILVGTGAVLGNGVAVMKDLDSSKPAEASDSTATQLHAYVEGGERGNPPEATANRPAGSTPNASSSSPVLNHPPIIAV